MAGAGGENPPMRRQQCSLRRHLPLPPFLHSQAQPGPAHGYLSASFSRRCLTEERGQIRRRYAVSYLTLQDQGETKRYGEEHRESSQSMEQPQADAPSPTWPRLLCPFSTTSPLHLVILRHAAGTLAPALLQGPFLVLLSLFLSVSGQRVEVMGAPKRKHTQPRQPRQSRQQPKQQTDAFSQLDTHLCESIRSVLVLAVSCYRLPTLLSLRCLRVASPRLHSRSRARSR